MESYSGSSTSLWMEEEALSFPSLRDDLRTEVCVIGAGISGLTTAYLLAKRGKQVAVIDDNPIGRGQTVRTTAHLVNAIDDRYFEVARIRGKDNTKIAAESHTAAIDFIEEAVRNERIECDFIRLDGYLFLPQGESADILEQELEAAHDAGLKEVEFIDHAPLPAQGTPCLRFPRQGQFHPMKYLKGLSEAIRRMGGNIYTDTHANDIKEDDTPLIVETQNKATISADAVVIATNAPIHDNALIYSKQAPYITYVIAAEVPTGEVERALYWDTLDPYHYVRLQSGATKDMEILIVGGEDHRTGGEDDASNRLHDLEMWARELFPPMQRIVHRWSGQVMETIDGLGLIGKKPGTEGNVFIATGDSGMGMTHGTIAAILLTDMILGHENPWQKLYDPSRAPLKAAKTFAQENIVSAKRLIQRLKPAEESPDHLKNNMGVIVQRGTKKIALHRDAKGEVHEFSAICPHRGCVVSWNSFERTWDCACHGSRYRADGTVINGPSSSNLDPISKESSQPKS